MVPPTGRRAPLRRDYQVMNELKFTKMHGTGNDFVFVDARSFSAADLETIRTDAAAICDRRFGAGCDQLLLLLPATRGGDFRMGIFNADGSEVEMCGNGIRCLAKYVADHALSKKEVLDIETAGGLIRPRIVDGLVEVDMGEPILEGEKIPTTGRGRIVNHPLQAAGKSWDVTCVSMGNPHCVTYVDDVDALDLQKIGPEFEHHQFFPKRVNTEFVQVLSKGHVRQRTYERGSAETLACGTGASAVCVAGVLTGKSAREVRIDLRGGTLQLRWDEASNHVYMTGPAASIYEGTLDLAAARAR